MFRNKISFVEKIEVCLYIERKKQTKKLFKIFNQSNAILHQVQIIFFWKLAIQTPRVPLPL